MSNDVIRGIARHDQLYIRVDDLNLIMHRIEERYRVKRKDNRSFYNGVSMAIEEIAAAIARGPIEEDK
jgi:hypothetical protein